MKSTSLWVRTDTGVGLMCFLAHSCLSSGNWRSASENNLSSEYCIPGRQQLVYQKAFLELVVQHEDLIKSRVELST